MPATGVIDRNERVVSRRETVKQLIDKVRHRPFSAQADQLPTVNEALNSSNCSHLGRIVACGNGTLLAFIKL
jgi:hypothetical protein